jgi:hypothetical protein
MSPYTKKKTYALVKLTYEPRGIQPLVVVPPMSKARTTRLPITSPTPLVGGALVQLGFSVARRALSTAIDAVLSLSHPSAAGTNAALSSSSRSIVAALTPSPISITYAARRSCVQTSRPIQLEYM